MSNALSNADDPLRNAMLSLRGSFVYALVFSCAVNILMLTGPLFMLQVYDRVLASRSVPTLVALFGLVVVLYAFLGAFDLIRTRILSRAGYRLDVELGNVTNQAGILRSRHLPKGKSDGTRDLQMIRQFLSSGGLLALFDFPWVPFYLGIVFLLHVTLGLVATLGALTAICIALACQHFGRVCEHRARIWDHRESEIGRNTQQSSDAIVANGMVSNLSGYRESMHFNALAEHQRTTNWSEFSTTATRTFRMLLQSSMLALGAYLAIHSEISAGTIIASSILGGRALAPIDTAIGNWRNYLNAKTAYQRLSELLREYAPSNDEISLPKITGNLAVSGLIKMSPAQGNHGRVPVLRDLSFDLSPGDGLAVLGANGAGKSLLARLLVGLEMPDRGSVRLDGATLDQWGTDRLGKQVGYLEQDARLFVGTIRENIARFDPTVRDEEVVAAAKLANVHDLILDLPEGYQTKFEPNKSVLSPGQCRRIAVACILLRHPMLVVFDEPGSNLDPEGEAGLTNTINALRQGGACVIVLAQRATAVTALNKALVLKQGQQIGFGLKEDVLRALAPHRAKPRLRAV